MKNKSGGYLIIDLKDNDLTGGPFTLSGIYEAIEGNYRKPILFSGITIDGVEKADVFATVEIDNTDFVVKLYDRTVTITSSDVVSSVAGGNHLYVYSMDLGDGTLADDCTLPNGSYIIFMTPEKIDTTKAITGDFYGICIQGTYNDGTQDINIGRFTLEEGEFIIEEDTADKNISLVENYSGVVTLETQLF